MYLRLIFVSFFLAIIIIYVLQSCKKEPVDNKVLIIGKWTGVSRIQRLTTTNPSTNELHFSSDTVICSPTGHNFSIEFKTDTLTSMYNIHVNIQHLFGVPYTINQNKLAFYGNPYEWGGPSQNPVLKMSTIDFLTNNKLILYDVDTINPVQFATLEAWHTFQK